jgi:hypothetical protein
VAQQLPRGQPHSTVLQVLQAEQHLLGHIFMLTAAVELTLLVAVDLPMAGSVCLKVMLEEVFLQIQFLQLLALAAVAVAVHLLVQVLSRLLLTLVLLQVLVLQEQVTLL